ncbi:MAG: hypothetical protein OXU98_08940 [Gammaproteobacteria bacterium]|nr:hypothetical protein [Gammaproteobacteria bacterium]
MPVIRETTFNAKLTDILRRKNPRWRTDDAAVAEGGRILVGGGTPDVFICPKGAPPIVVETEFMPARTVEEDAEKRLGCEVRGGNMLIEQVVALRAPATVKQTSAARLEEAICAAQLEYCLLSADPSYPKTPAERWPRSGWLQGGVDDLVALLENALVSERLIADSLEILEGGVNAAAARLIAATHDKPAVISNIAKLLHQSEGPQTTRMAMAIVANALTFHAMLGGTHAVKSFKQLRRTSQKLLMPDDVLDEWWRIIDDINYYPIFDIACRVITEIPTRATFDVVQILSRVAGDLVALGITASHDLYGRMFQRLITDRKFLATFYTLPESAMLLAEVAVDKLDVDFADESTAPALRIADFACGTGTLLGAAYHAVLARHRRAGHDDADIHKQMMEESLIATDIMPAGVHLTASILSSVHPAVTFDDTKVYTLPYGWHDNGLFLGALDLIDKQASRDLLQTRKRLGGRGEKQLGASDLGAMFQLEHESCDLVIMNPPFTRPTNHEITDKPVPSFAGFNTSEDEQRAMSRRLRKISTGLPDFAGDGYAGLASNFIDLVHQKLKPGGIMAMVLPATFARGKGWLRSRRFVDAHYDDIIVVSLVSSGAHTTSFSADTAMAEVLLIGKKRARPRKQGHAPVNFVALLKRPVNAAQSAEVARAIKAANNGIQAGGEHLGEMTLSSLANGGAVGVMDNALLDTVIALRKNILRLPSATEKHPLPIAKLGDIAARGLVHRLINGKHPVTGEFSGPFDIEKLRGVPTYPCLWAHHADLERAFIVKPDSQGRVRRGMQDAADAVWKTRSTLHFNLDFRLNSQSLAACVTPMPSIGGTAWPNVRPHNDKHEAALMLWANSTPGLLLRWYCGSRQQAGRARITISQLPDLPVLDTRALTPKQHRLAARIFNRFKSKTFLPANEAYHDPTRHQLDRALLVELLGLPESILQPLETLRRKWCFEPSVHGGKKTRPPED